MSNQITHVERQFKLIFPSRGQRARNRVKRGGGGGGEIYKSTLFCYTARLFPIPLCVQHLLSERCAVTNGLDPAIFHINAWK